MSVIFIGIIWDVKETERSKYLTLEVREIQIKMKTQRTYTV